MKRILFIATLIAATSCSEERVGKEPQAAELPPIPPSNYGLLERLGANDRSNKNGRILNGLKYVEYFECSQFNDYYLPPIPYKNGIVMLDENGPDVPWYFQNATVFEYRESPNEAISYPFYLRIKKGGSALMWFTVAADRLTFSAHKANPKVGFPDGVTDQRYDVYIYNGGWKLFKQNLTAYDDSKVTVQNSYHDYELPANLQGSSVAVGFVAKETNSHEIDIFSVALKALN